MHPRTLKAKLIVAYLLVIGNLALAVSPVFPKENRLVVPKCKKPPTIDGMIKAGEWTRAAATTGFQSIFGYMTSSQPTFYITYDDKNLYVAMDSRIPEYARLKRVTLENDGRKVCADDTLELFIAPDYEKRMQLMYQFLGNSLGVIMDVLRKYNIGNHLVLWNGHWNFKNSYGPGYWHAEISVPFEDLNLTSDQTFGINFCRDYYKYKFTNWTTGGFRNLAVADFGGEKAPAIQVLDLGNILQADMNMKLAVAAGTNPVKLTTEIKVLLEEDCNQRIAETIKTFTVGAGKNQIFQIPLNWQSKEGKIQVFQEPGGGQSARSFLRIPEFKKRKKQIEWTIKNVDTGKIYQKHTFLMREGVRDYFDKTPARAFDAEVDIYQTFNRVVASVGTFDFTKKKEMVKVNVAIRPKGRKTTIATGDIKKFKLGYGEAAMDIPKDLPEGKYEAVFIPVDKNGKELATEVMEFEKKSFPWEEVHVASSDEVIPPFTPLKLRDRRVSCWGREYEFAETGFLEQVITRDKKILKNPIVIKGKLNGKELLFNPIRKFEILKKEPGVIKLRGYSRSGELRLKVIAAVEFDGFIKYEVTLAPDAELTIDKLYLDIPMKNQHAIFYHAVGEAIRLTNRTGRVAEGNGVVWTSREVSNSKVLGTFIPYFWLGDYDRGFCFMADSDKNWVTSSKVPAVEFIRNGGVLNARLNLWTRKKSIEDPRKIVFGLMAGPARPEPKGWRWGYLHPGNTVWYYTATGSFQHWGRLRDEKKWLEEVSQRVKRTGRKFGVNLGPNDLGKGSPEHNYYYGEWYPAVCTPARVDMQLYYLNKLIEEHPELIGGLYSDDVYPVPDNNLYAGRGYMREDGKIQYTYNMFALRDFFKRTARLFHKKKLEGRMRCHMTDSTVLPLYCFWDFRHAPEWSQRGGPQDFHPDGWPLEEICGRIMGRQYGWGAFWHTPAGWYCAFQGNDTGGDDLNAICMIHDIIPRTSTWGDRNVPAMIDFGIGEDDVDFIGYWESGAEFGLEDKKMKLSAWVRKDKGTALITVANLGKKDWHGNVEIPADKFGRKGNWVLCDAEDRRPTISRDANNIKLKVAKHNYRLLLAGPKGVFQTDLPPLGQELKPKSEIIVSEQFEGGNFLKKFKLTADNPGKIHLKPYRNRLLILGPESTKAAVEMPFDKDDISVQVRFEAWPSTLRQSQIGIALFWKNGSYVFAGSSHRRFMFGNCENGNHSKTKMFDGLQMDENPAAKLSGGRLPASTGFSQKNWVKIELRPKKIVFFCSGDGKKWVKGWEVKRKQSTQMSPPIFRLGRNLLKEKPSRTGQLGYRPVYFDDLIISKLQEGAK